MSKPSFLTESFGRRTLSVILASILLLVITVTEVAPSKENEGADKQEIIRRVVQNYINVGKEQYGKRFFEQAEKTFLMAQGYQEYLTAAGREQLNELLKQARIGVSKRKRTLEAFRTVNELIKRDQLIEASAHLEKIKENEFLTKEEQRQVAEALRLIDIEIIEAEAHLERVNEKKSSTEEKPEKLPVKKIPGELDKQEEMVALFYRSIGLYYTGQLEKAREGFVKVGASGLIPALMEKARDRYLTEIDKLLVEKAGQTLVRKEENPEVAAVAKPEVDNPGINNASLAEMGAADPNVVELEATDPNVAEPEAADANAVEAEAAEPNVVEAEVADANAVEEEVADANAVEEGVAEPNIVEQEVVPPEEAAPATTEGSYIDAINLKRSILRSHARAVVNDAVIKAHSYMNEGRFDKAKQVVETAELTVNQNPTHLGDELFKEYTDTLKALTEEIIRRENEKAQQVEEERRKAAIETQRQFIEQTEIEKEKRIAILMENAVAFQKQQRYQAALGQLESLLELDPQHDAALTLKDTLEDTIYFRKQLEIQKEADRQRADILLKTDESGIPYAEELTYPKNWREIIEKPTRQPDKPIGLDPLDVAVYEQLDLIVDLSELTPTMALRTR